MTENNNQYQRLPDNSQDPYFHQQVPGAYQQNYGASSQQPAQQNGYNYMQPVQSYQQQVVQQQDFNQFQPIRYSQRQSITRNNAYQQQPGIQGQDGGDQPPPQMVDPAVQERAFRKQVENLRGELVYTTILVFTISIALFVNGPSYSCVFGFNAKKWLTGLDVIYAVDIFLISLQTQFLQKHRKESVGYMFLRALLLITLVVWLIIGNVDYYPDRQFGCGPLKIIAFIMIILGYFEMLKCCCIGTLVCLFIPIIIFASRQAQRPNWIPAAPQYVQNLYKTITAHNRSKVAKYKRIYNIAALCFKQPKEEITLNRIAQYAFSKNDEIIPLPCDERHFFHAACITSWLEKNNNCPLCKKPITLEALQQQQQKIQQQINAPPHSDSLVPVPPQIPQQQFM